MLKVLITNYSKLRIHSKPDRNQSKLLVCSVSIQLRHYEKATKFEKITHRFWQISWFYSVVSKHVGDFFKFLWPSQNSWTLPTSIFQFVGECQNHLNKFDLIVQRKWIISKLENKVSTYIRNALSGWAGWARPEFGVSIYPIPTRGQIMFTTLQLAHPNLKT